MRRGLLVGMGLVLVGGVVTPAVTPVGVDSASAAVTGVGMPFDFNGDGYADLAVGVPGEDLRGRRDAGAVQVLYGSASGVTAHDQIWHQGRKGVKGALEKGDRFGTTLASADFDSDGYADLAIGIPGEGIGRKIAAGAVQVLFGGPAGLTASGDQVWHQGKKGVPGRNESGDRFGVSLAVGDFDGDRFSDLAIGIPDEDVGSKNDAGTVVVLRGSGSGLTSVGAVKLRQGLNGLPSRPDSFEAFGAGLSAGDINGDDRDDLVVVGDLDADFHLPKGELDEASSPVHVIFGTPAGLSPSGSQFFSPEALGFKRWAAMGATLADLNGDGLDDLAGKVFQYSPRITRVVVLHGHPDGLHLAPLAVAKAPGMDGIVASPEGYGGLVATDFNGDGPVDLVVSAGTTAPMTMSVAVILGTGSGLGSSFVESPIGIAKRFTIQALSLSGGTHPWLVLGNPEAEVGSGYGTGLVGVLRGTPAGTAGPVTVWTQDSPGIKGKAESGDSFGILG